MKKINFIITLFIFTFCFLGSGIYHVQASSSEFIFNNTSSNIGPLTDNPVFNDSSINSGTITGNATFNDYSINETTGIITGDACFSTTAQNKGTVRGTISVCGAVVNPPSGGGTASGGGIISVGERMACKKGDKFSITTGLPCPTQTTTNPAQYCPITTTLVFGSRGGEVKCLQKTLNIKQDGVFGKNTEAIVKVWQKKSGLAADGIFGIKSRGVWNNPH